MLVHIASPIFLRRALLGAVSALALSTLAADPAAAQGRRAIVVDDSVLDQLGPQPSVAGLLHRGSAPAPVRAAPPSSAVAQAPRPAPAQAPRSRVTPPSQVAAAPRSTLLGTFEPFPTLPGTVVAAVAPSAPMAPMPSASFPQAAAPAGRMPASPPLPAVQAPPAFAAPALPSAPVSAPLPAGVRAPPSEMPRSRLTLPPGLAVTSEAPRPPAPVAAPALAAAPPPAPASSSPWPSPIGTAVAAPRPVPMPELTPPPPPPARVEAAPPPTRAALTTPPATAPAAGAGITTRLTYAPGAALPSDGADGALQRFATQVGGRRVQVLAYASANSGIGAGEARRLSLDRALAVRTELSRRGVPREQVVVRALGAEAGDGPADRVDLGFLD